MTHARVLEDFAWAMPDTVVVTNSQGIGDPRSLGGKVVTISDLKYRVTSVDCFAIALPYPKHLTYGLRVELIKQ